MTTLSYTELRQGLAHYLDEVVATRAPIVVTRQRGRGNVVMLAESEFAGLQETVHLLSSPRNAERLLRAARDADAGSAEERTLLPESDTTPA